MLEIFLIERFIIVNFKNYKPLTKNNKTKGATTKIVVAPFYFFYYLFLE